MLNSPAPSIVAPSFSPREHTTSSKANLSVDTKASSRNATLSPMSSIKCPSVSPTGKYQLSNFPKAIEAIEGSDVEKLRPLIASRDDVLVVDVRPFNFFCTSRIKNSYNICIPTTLLKRPKYDLTHVINASSLPAHRRDFVLNPVHKTKVLLYDAASTDSHISFQLYQTILKFLAHDRFTVMYLRGGFDHADCSLVDTSSTSPMRSPLSPNTPHSALTANDSTNPDSDVHCNDPPPGDLPFLCGFTLPSATKSDQKLLSSMKKSLPKLDTTTSYKYDFKFPSNLGEIRDKLPKWLAFFGELFDKPEACTELVTKFGDMFDRLEKSEKVRLRMAISNTSKGLDDEQNMDLNLHDTVGFGTPSTLCPCCDPIDYTIPKGVEYGYKNRYNNIWPYEHSRVRLVDSPSNTHRKESDDYFNANYIHFDKLSQNRYIATQSPLEATKGDFWNTVWYNSVKAIVCLNATQIVSPNAYYDSDSYIESSRLSIKIECREEYDGFTVREITLSKHGKQHTLYHFAFWKWPDFGTPDDLSTVFKLIEVKNSKLSHVSSYKPPTSKIPQAWDLLVHCSAGCGRTGCFITLDMVMDSFNNPRVSKGCYDPWGEDDLIYKSVQFQRQQRISMVQTLDQFICCYEGILRYVAQNMV